VRERGGSSATAIWEESRTSCAPPSTHLHVPLSLEIWQDTRVGRRPEPWNPNGSASGTSTTQRKRKSERNTFERERAREKVVVA